MTAKNRILALTKLAKAMGKYQVGRYLDANSQDVRNRQKKMQNKQQFADSVANALDSVDRSHVPGIMEGAGTLIAARNVPRFLRSRRGKWGVIGGGVSALTGYLTKALASSQSSNFKNKANYFKQEADKLGQEAHDLEDTVRGIEASRSPYDPYGRSLGR